MKHILAAIVTILALGAMFMVYQSDREVNKVEEISKMIAKSEIKVHLDNTAPVQEESDASREASKADLEKEQEKKKKELDEKLQALKNKAGNVAAFKVSPLYKQKCSSCHGVNGGGIIGPKLRGLSAETVYKDLGDFKSGVRKNYVMYGLLSKMNDGQLKELADEIGTFEQKYKAQQ
ncbi:Cytochrome c family protein [hydrothermal vent metagenome]|uniref:Cytochrome c family protein n=1 Tax=hydrothermal vent metagenome TaxID=652676 RepID=A0A1W1CCZ8_9ZZZZ